MLKNRLGPVYARLVCSLTQMGRPLRSFQIYRFKFTVPILVRELGEGRAHGGVGFGDG
jgi:hypothetical protein